MNKLALIGKDIAHSKSPEIYRRLISPHVHYDLLDFKKEDEIPDAQTLLGEYDGINITSPYKKHFLNQIELTAVGSELGAINCLKKREGKIIGENTDYYAMIDIVKNFQQTYGDLSVVILGDGVMSHVAQVAFKNMGLIPTVFSRRITNDFNQLNLEIYFAAKSGRPLVVNTCSRQYVFKGKLPSNSVFWDFNYDFFPHLSTLSTQVHLYCDGLEMLERQALYAVAFWSDRQYS